MNACPSCAAPTLFGKCNECSLKRSYEDEAVLLPPEPIATCGTCGKPPSFNCREHYASTISSLRAENENLREQLRRIEWINFGGACSANCPECGLHKKDGHHKSCGLAALLAKKGGA